MPLKVVSYWCLPREEDAAACAAVIGALAAAQGAPVFVPHLTLATLTVGARDLSAVTQVLRGLALTPLGLDGNGVFTTSLFVRFAPSDQLLAARRRMEALPDFRKGRAFDPHISLCYGPPPDLEAQRGAIAALLSRPMRFDRLAAVELFLPVETYEDVAGWTVRESWKF
ncbi:MAG: 2'-5' RNA ligase family protein [Hyphomonas sp.]